AYAGLAADSHDVGGQGPGANNGAAEGGNIVAAVVVEVPHGQGNAPAGGGYRGQKAGHAAIFQRFDGQPARSQLPANGGWAGIPPSEQRSKPHDPSPFMSRSAIE